MFASLHRYLFLMMMSSAVRRSVDYSSELVYLSAYCNPWLPFLFQSPLSFNRSRSGYQPRYVSRSTQTEERDRLFYRYNAGMVEWRSMHVRCRGLIKSIILSFAPVYQLLPLASLTPHPMSRSCMSSTTCPCPSCSWPSSGRKPWGPRW